MNVLMGTNTLTVLPCDQAKKKKKNRFSERLVLSIMSLSVAAASGHHSSLAPSNLTTLFKEAGRR